MHLNCKSHYFPEHDFFVIQLSVSYHCSTLPILSLGWHYVGDVFMATSLLLRNHAPARLDASTLLYWYYSTRSAQQASSSATRPGATGKVPSPPLSLSLFSVVNQQHYESVTKCMYADHCVSNIICSLQSFLFVFVFSWERLYSQVF